MIPIVFAFDKKFLPPAYIAIRSLIDSARKDTKYKIIILYMGKIDWKVCELYRTVKSTRHEMVIRDIRKYDIFSPVTSSLWPKVVYAKLYLASWLKEYDKVIFSDVDVLFRGDLTDVFEDDLKEYEWGVAAERNDMNVSVHQYFAENKHEYIYMSGFMIMNLAKMRMTFWQERCDDVIKRYINELYMYDLEVLNLTAENIKGLPFRYVYLQSLFEAEDIEDAGEFAWLNRIYSKEYLLAEKEKAVIIHYAGHVGRIGKPWLRYNPPQYYKQYLRELPFPFWCQNNGARAWKNIKCVIRAGLN